MPAPSSMEIVSKLGDLLRRRSSSSIGAAQLEAAHKEHNKDGLTPLHVAVASGSIPVCEELLKAGAPINAYTFRLAFCMHLNGRALTCGHWVKRGKTGKFERLQETDLSTLHLAVSVLIDRCSPCHSNKGVDTSLIRFLIDNGSDVDALDGRGRTALQMAVSGSLYEVVEMLASSSAQIPATALHLATNREDVKMVRLLVKLGANLDARQMNGQGIGWTPLCLAARAGAVDVIRELVASRANVHAISANGKSALEIATINRKRGSCQTVLEILHIEMVSSVLEIAMRHGLPTTPHLNPVSAPLPPPMFTSLPPPCDTQYGHVGSEDVSLLHAAPPEPLARRRPRRHRAAKCVEAEIARQRRFEDLALDIRTDFVRPDRSATVPAAQRAVEE